MFDPNNIIRSTFISYSTIHLKAVFLPLKTHSNTVLEESILTLGEHPFIDYLVWRQKTLEQNSYHNNPTCVVIVLTFVFVFLIDCPEQIFSKSKCNLSTLSQIICSTKIWCYFWHMTVFFYSAKIRSFYSLLKVINNWKIQPGLRSKFKI